MAIFGEQEKAIFIGMVQSKGLDDELYLSPWKRDGEEVVYDTDLKIVGAPRPRFWNEWSGQMRRVECSRTKQGSPRFARGLKVLDDLNQFGDFVVAVHDHVRDDFPDGYMITGITSPAFPDEVFDFRVSFEHCLPSEIEKIASVVRNFSNLSVDVRDECARVAWRDFQRMDEISDLRRYVESLPKGPSDVWDYVSIFGFAAELWLQSEAAFAVVHTSPIWEEEHGMNFVFENGDQFLGINRNGEGGYVSEPHGLSEISDNP